MAIGTEQWIILGVFFGLGLLLGLLLRSGGAKWRRKYESEREARIALRRDYDAHLKRHHEAQPIERETLRAGSF